jgi:hypothetical protein
LIYLLILQICSVKYIGRFILFNIYGMKRVTVYRKQGYVPPDIPGNLNNLDLTGFIISKRGKGIALPGQLWGWGYNLYGAFGNNTVGSTRTPVNIGGQQTFCAIGGSLFASMRIDKSGFGWACGRNSTGEVG